MKVRDIIKLLQKDGWYLDRIRGSHRQYKHQNKSGAVTVSGHQNDDISIGTLKSIYKQARFEDDLL